MTYIPMWHPDHGRKVAYLEQEAENDEAHGWIRGYPVLKSNSQDVATESETVTIESDGAMPESSEPAESAPAFKPRRGRPRKVTDDGNSTDAD